MSVEALALLEEMQKLMELKGENPFKVRAFEKAVQALSGRNDLATRANAGTLTELPGIGKGIAGVLTDFLVHGKTTARDELAQSVPEGMLELTGIPGVGPKKALLLIEELGIKSVGELEYACQENRLLKLKGFGPKVQEKILESIRFQKQNSGWKRLDEVLPVAAEFHEMLQAACGNAQVSETGALRRRHEVQSELDFLIEDTAKSKAESAFRRFEANRAGLLPIRLFFAPARRFGYELARTTCTQESWKALGEPSGFDAKTEHEFFEKLDLPFIPPESRETGEEVRLARSGQISELLAIDGVQGVFHNHTHRSDGVATLEEMVLATKRLGYKYIGISDHSQSAFYAQGLKTDSLKEQEKEIRKVQDKYPEIRIFWGIESDILADGSLDYETSVLKKFDFVVASVHSRFKMDRDTMTERILEAIRNPHTRFLGHATGRLLLGRKGYDVDMEKVIAEAAKHDVAIEINSHPQRLDIDWRWGPELRKRKTLVSINPDAHEIAGLEDTRYGIWMARKALLPSSLVVNSRPVKEVEKWLARA